MKMFEKVCEVFAEELCIDREKITPESALKEDLGLDSLDLISLIDELEETYDIRFPDEEMNVRTVGEVVEVLERLVAQKG